MAFTPFHFNKYVKSQSLLKKYVKILKKYVKPQKTIAKCVNTMYNANAVSERRNHTKAKCGKSHTQNYNPGADYTANSYY